MKIEVNIFIKIFLLTKQINKTNSGLLTKATTSKLYTTSTKPSQNNHNNKYNIVLI